MIRIGVYLPLGIMDAMKGLSKTGLWNQLYKVPIVAYFLRHFVPFMLYNRPSVASPRVYGWLKALKQNEAKEVPVGVAGFCWGGHFVTTLCHDKIRTDAGDRLIACGYVAHPSFLSYPSDIEKIVLPYSCAAAEIDQQMSAKNASKTKEILAAKTAKSKDQGIEHEFVMYSGVKHGFAVRADEDEKDVAEAGKKAEEQAVKWFARWFANPPPS